MPAQKLVIPFPQQGVNRTYVRSNQNQYQQGYLAQFLPQSCWDANNILPYDPAYGRLRGGQRSPIINLNITPNQSGNIQGMIVTSISNPSLQGVQADFFLYIDRMGIPKAVLLPGVAMVSTTAYVATNGYVEGMESFLFAANSSSYFVDVNSKKISYKGTLPPTWGVFVSPTLPTIAAGMGQPPTALAYGANETQYSGIFDVKGNGTFFDSPNYNPSLSMAADVFNNALFNTAYPQNVRVQAVVRTGNPKNTGGTSQAVGVFTGYPPQSGTASFTTECAYTAVQLGVSAGIVAYPVVQSSTMNPGSPSSWFQGAVTSFNSSPYRYGLTYGNHSVLSAGMLIAAGVPGGAPAGPTYTAKTLINNAAGPYSSFTPGGQFGSVLFAPVNTSPFGVYSFGAQGTASGYGWSLNGTGVNSTATWAFAATSTPSGIAGPNGILKTPTTTGGTQTVWNAVSGDYTNTNPLATVTGVNLFELLSGPSFTFAFTVNNSNGTNAVTQVIANPLGTYTGSSVVGANTYSFTTTLTDYDADAAVWDLRISDGRCVMEQFVYSGHGNGSLDNASLGIWSSYYVAPASTGPLSQIFNGSVNTNSFQSPAATGQFDESQFVQGVTGPGSAFPTGFYGSILAQSAVYGMLTSLTGATRDFFCGISVGYSNSNPTGSAGGVMGICFGTTDSGSWSLIPAYEVAYHPDTGLLQLRHWTVGAAVSTMVVDASYSTPAYSTLTSTGPVNIGLQSVGGVLRLMYNGIAVGPSVTTSDGISLYLNEGTISPAIAYKYSAAGQKFTVYTFGIFPAKSVTYLGPLSERLISINGGQVFNYSVNANVYTDTGSFGRQTYFNTLGPVQLCSIGQLVYAVDGVQNGIINPNNGQIQPLIPVFSPGGNQAPIPQGCTLCCEWLSCLILSGQFGAPTAVYGSRINTPGDFDFSQVDAAAAFALALQQQQALAGVVPTPVTALMPAKNDALCIGCVDSVWVLTGLPNAGGRLININRGSGVFGANAWCRDDIGNVYWANNSGLFAWSGQAPPQNLSFNSFDQFFQAIDGSSNTITLQYDPKRWLIWIFVTPNSGGAGSHLVYDLRGQGFWPQTFPSGASPYASAFMNSGTPAQRELVFGGINGKLYTFDTGAFASANVYDLHTTPFVETPINGYVVLGPIQPGGPISDAIVSAIDLTFGETASGDSSNAFGGSYTLSGGKSAYDVTQGTANVTRTGSFAMDWNNPSTVRCRGGWFSIKLQAGDGQYMSMEHVTLTVEAEGRQR